MNTSPMVSVVVPTFNQGHYLPVALDSVMFQSYPNIEIIICNHGSTDGTSEVIRTWLRDVETETVSFLHHYEENSAPGFIRQTDRRYPDNRKITVVESDENIGGTNSYNEGFKKALGEFCTYLVADDYFLPHAVSTMVDVLITRNVDIAFSDMHVVDDQGRILQKIEKPAFDEKSSLADWFHLGVSRLYRRKLHDVSGFYDPGYRNANDYDMFLRFAMDGASFLHIPQVLYCTRKHDPDDKNEPASWRNNGYGNLMRESILCARRARAWLSNKSRG